MEITKLDKRSLSRLKNIFISFLSLSITLSSLFLIIVAPIEIKAVHDSNQWEKIPARMISAQYERSDFKRGVQVAVYKFTDLKNGNIVTTSDVEPGDFPFSIDFFGAKAFDTQAKYFQEFAPNAELGAIRRSDGKKYFLKQGNYNTMRIVILMSISWLLYVFLYARKKAARENS